MFCSQCWDKFLPWKLKLCLSVDTLSFRNMQVVAIHAKNLQTSSTSLHRIASEIKDLLHFTFAITAPYSVWNLTSDLPCSYLNFLWAKTPYKVHKFPKAKNYNQQLQEISAHAGRMNAWTSLHYTIELNTHTPLDPKTLLTLYTKSAYEWIGLNPP